MHEKLLSELDALRQQTARFRRVSLHLHSPVSRDWARSGDKERNRKDKFLAAGGASLFLDELRPYFDMVAVTDHMKCGYACEVSQATVGADACIVLPGMEVNFKPDAALGSIRIHLVVILPQRRKQMVLRCRIERYCRDSPGEIFVFLRDRPGQRLAGDLREDFCILGAAGRFAKRFENMCEVANGDPV